ncbi:MAG: class I SAM-dependent methyltransferase [Actinomycetota bacterium]|nr:class I SAM-dependent methyltransferase [Actinomycetota bacterium]
MNREASREWTAALYRRFLPGEADAYATFLGLAQSGCPEGGTVVDLGCGDECYLACLSGKAAEIIGVDERPLRGAYGRYVQADLDRDIGLDAGCADLAASKFLIEHLGKPGEFFRQVYHSLRPGGMLVVMTPNVLYYPYAVNLLLSRLLDQERRMKVVGFFSGRGRHEIFPVYYRCNTPRRLRAELEAAGFEVVHLGTYGDYLASAVNRTLGAVAVAYEKAVSLLGLEYARGFIVAAAVRK